MTPDPKRRIKRDPRPEWVRAEYERIGDERERAGRQADRVYRRELVRVCCELIFWMFAGVIVAAFAFHVHDRETGKIFLYGGMVVNLCGVTYSLATAYRRGEERGDW